MSLSVTAQTEMARMTCVLVVEGVGEIREILVEAIQDAGFRSVDAATAEAGVQLLNQEAPQLIVTPINLPGPLDGIGLARVARESHPAMPVIFISCTPAMLDRARSFGSPAAFLQKPFSLKTLVGDINRMASGELLTSSERDRPFTTTTSLARQECSLPNRCPGSRPYQPG
jgi:DNA-binding response OmpR family regulator